MVTFPHDLSDLHLAPAALALDARIQQMGTLGRRELTVQVALESDCPDRTRADREKALLKAMAYVIDCHGWALAWDPRGVRLSHDGHHLVLGTPASCEASLVGAG